MLLTTATIKAARPGARPFKMADGGGLYVLVRPSGQKVFRFKYRRGRGEQLLTLGAWPELELGRARELRDQARDALQRNADPKLAITAAPADAATFEQLGRRWHAEQLPHWSIEHAADVLASLERDVFPAIGALDPGRINARQVRELLRVVEQRGCIETARRLRERISGIFRLGIHDELCAGDPAAIVADRLGPRPLQTAHPALTELNQARALLAAVDRGAGAPIAKLASRFLALTAVRLGTLRRGRWREIEGLDGPSPIWRVPPAHLKLTQIRKGDPSAELIVPLSRQAAALLRIVFALTGAGDDDLIFPGRIAGRPIGEGAIGDLYAAAGYAGRHVPHGWRASFSTILNERFPEKQQLIDQALGHAGKGKVEAAYNRSRHIERMGELMQIWADLIAPEILALPAPAACA